MDISSVKKRKENIIFVLCHNNLQTLVLPVDGVIVASVGDSVGTSVVDSVSIIAYKYSMLLSIQYCIFKICIVKYLLAKQKGA